MTEFTLMMEFILQIESGRFCFVGWLCVGSASSEYQGVCGDTGDPVLEQSIVSVVHDSRLRRGEGQGMKSDAEVLHEGTWEASENNEYREDVPVVLAVVGELFNISNASASPTVPRWRRSDTELPRDIEAGGRASCSCSCPDICDRGSSSSESSGKDSRPRTGESASGDGGHWMFSKVSLTIGVCGNASITELGEILSLALSRS